METTTTHTLAEQPAIQTIAQAVAQATQQAQIGIQQQSSQPSAIDNLTCQWQGCGERTDNAEALYDHVCERHVGRKSTNNLNLTCQWGACRTTTVKRDHITSHIRVHVPLKPHKCDFCGKSFKRPQDLKKHVKTHADDSVLANSPQQNSAGRNSVGGNGGMGTQNGGTANYYQSGDNQMSGNAFSSYQSGMASNGGNNGGYGSGMNNGQYGGYGSVSYPSNAAMADIQSMDTRRRAIEALNDFLGDIKRRAINPNNYYDVGHRLQGNSLPLPVSNGYNTGYNNIGTGYNGASAASLLETFNNTDHMGSGLHGGMTQHGYSLPVPNARTKNDLQDIDRFLEQLQATVYETSTHAAAAGVQQPGMHTQYAGDYNFGNQQRSSNSPTNFNNYSNAGANSLGGLLTSAMQSMPNGTSGIDTPALTPSSMSSYTSSGHSPMSNPSRASLGSLGGTSMYPSLPSVTGMSDLGSGYPTTTSAPASSLASGYEGLDGRRYSGGRLQRQAPDRDTDTDMADADDGSRTPKASDAKESKGKSSNTIDPALRGEDGSDSGSTSASRSDGEDKRQEEWIENIRTIEALRKWISQRLQTGEYEDGDEHANGDSTTGADADVDAAAKTTEIAKLVEEKLANAEAAKSDEEMDVKYPSLPTT